MLNDEFMQTIFQFISETNALSYNISKDHKPENITLLQYNLLEYLYLNDGVSLKKICSHMSMSIGSTRREISKLIDLGYIHKEKDIDDKRLIKLYINRKGKLLLDECFFQFVKDVNKKYEYLSEEEQINLSECMKYIIKKLCI